jgi:CheY-like chemotaxis protein
MTSDDHDPNATDLSDPLRGVDILLVEDALYVGEAIKNMLDSLGADVIGPAATTAEAERLLTEHAPDVALVDFHLRGGELSSDLITRLHDPGIPVIVTSGSEADLEPPVKTATILEKPFSELQLLTTLYPLIAHKAEG